MTTYELIKSIFLVWVVFMAVGVAIRVNHNDMLEGKVKSEYLSTYQSIDLPPEEARFFNVTVDLYDLQISDVTILK